MCVRKRGDWLKRWRQIMELAKIVRFVCCNVPISQFAAHISLSHSFSLLKLFTRFCVVKCCDANCYMWPYYFELARHVWFTSKQASTNCLRSAPVNKGFYYMTLINFTFFFGSILGNYLVKEGSYQTNVFRRLMLELKEDIR